MTAPLQDAVRQQLPVFESFSREHGPLESAEFRGVTGTGADKYLVTYHSGKQLEYFITLDADGRISGLLARQAF
jgi:hypothetical protein